MGTNPLTLLDPTTALCTGTFTISVAYSPQPPANEIVFTASSRTLNFAGATQVGVYTVTVTGTHLYIYHSSTYGQSGLLNKFHSESDRRLLDSHCHKPSQLGIELYNRRSFACFMDCPRLYL